MDKTEYINSKNELINYLNFKKADTLNLKLFNENGSFEKGLEMLSYLKDNINNLNEKTTKIILTVPYEKIPKKLFIGICDFYNNSEPKRPIELSIEVNHTYEHEFYYEEKSMSWDIETIIKANTEIDNVCQFIKESNFSPMEALAYIHDYVSTITAYNNSSSHAWYAKDQFFSGAYQYLPEFICAGFSSLMKEIIDNLKMPGLECEIFAIPFKHLKKLTSENHARCFVKISDPKYGVEQSVFDDPTWDNEKNLIHKYTHFSMPNDCLEQRRNKLYTYYCPEKAVFSKNKAKYELVDENLYIDSFNRSKNQIDQLMIEKIYLNVLTKSLREKSFDDIYSTLSQMAKDSFEEQVLREYDGNLISESLQLSRDEAFKIFNQDPYTRKIKLNNEEINLQKN